VPAQAEMDSWPRLDTSASPSRTIATAWLERLGEPAAGLAHSPGRSGLEGDVRAAPRASTR
jgi:hypothetical protein